MNSLKFLKDDPFCFVSEYASLHSDPNLNTITFPVAQDNSFLRIYMESEELNLSLFKKGEEYPVQQWKTNFIQAELDQGDYTLKMDYFTDFARKKALNTDMKVHYTFLLATKETQDVRYKKAQGSALFNCDGN